MSLPKPARIAELTFEAIESLQPVNEFEHWFVSQVAYAAWEMETVRLNADNLDAEPRLNAAYSRAHRVTDDLFTAIPPNLLILGGYSV